MGKLRQLFNDLGQPLLAFLALSTKCDHVEQQNNLGNLQQLLTGFGGLLAFSTSIDQLEL